MFTNKQHNVKEIIRGGKLNVYTLKELCKKFQIR